MLPPCMVHIAEIIESSAFKYLSGGGYYIMMLCTSTNLKYVYLKRCISELAVDKKYKLNVMSTNSVTTRRSPVSYTDMTHWSCTLYVSYHNMLV